MMFNFKILKLKSSLLHFLFPPDQSQLKFHCKVSWTLISTACYWCSGERPEVNALRFETLEKTLKPQGFIALEGT